MKLSKGKYSSSKDFEAEENPQNSNPSKYYAMAKKERGEIQSKKNEISNQVQYMRKVNERLQKSLSKRKIQLNYIEQVRKRYESQLLQKQEIKKLKELQLLKIKERTSLNKINISTKVKQSRNKILEQKKSSSNIIRQTMRELKVLKELKEDKIREINKSRIEEVEIQRKKTQERYNEVFSSNKRRSVEDYRFKTKRQENKKGKMEDQMKELEGNLLELRKDSESKKIMLEKLNDEINCVRDVGSRISKRNTLTQSHKRFENL